MPRGNRAGPRGQGPRSGRGLGYCSGYSTPGYTKSSGMGWGRGYGGGRGWGGGGWGRGRGFYPGRENYPLDQPIPMPPLSISREDETKYLEETLGGLKKEIENIEKRLEELSKKGES